MQHDTTINETNSTKISNKKSLKINLEYFESDSMTDEIFGMKKSMEKNYHISSDEIDRIFDRNAIHSTEVKHYEYDDYNQLKD